MNGLLPKKKIVKKNSVEKLFKWLLNYHPR